MEDNLITIRDDIDYLRTDGDGRRTSCKQQYYIHYIISLFVFNTLHAFLDIWIMNCCRLGCDSAMCP